MESSVWSRFIRFNSNCGLAPRRTAHGGPFACSGQSKVFIRRSKRIGNSRSHIDSMQTSSTPPVLDLAQDLQPVFGALTTNPDPQAEDVAFSVTTVFVRTSLREFSQFRPTGSLAS